ncbi:MAG TPA: hypothetical protein VNH18_25295 [Bryobacteraceae bacterium]|nr:hypothetical protein [Bryobacteraceae bacterium]
MPTPFESAQLILNLYELRREETLRKARDFFIGFDPQTTEEFMAAMMGPQGAYVRMVISYWDMAASLVRNGAIDQRMFTDATGEFILVFGKMEPFIPQLRETFGNPEFLANLEWLALGIPDARNRIDGTVARIRGVVAARAKMQTA